MKMTNVEDVYPLSPMQQGMFFHSLYAPDSGVYLELLTVTLYGALNVQAFKQAWQQVVDRHAVLRSEFYWENVKEPLQVVRQKVTLPWQAYDWQALTADEQKEQLEAYLAAEHKKGFSFSQAPLMRCALMTLSSSSYQFVWSSHHLLMDGWSKAIVLKDFFMFYDAATRGQKVYLEPARPYRDYIAWLQQQALSQAEAFWKPTLQGFTAPTPLVVDRSTTSDAHALYQKYEFHFSATITAMLSELARKHRLTLNTFFQGAWAILLSRYNGAPAGHDKADVLFGATVSGRPPALKGVESMVGLFINTLPVRVQVADDAPLIPWLQALQSQQVARESYSFTPLVEIQRWSEVPAGTPLFESIVVFENYPVDDSFSDNELSPGISLAQMSPVRVIEQSNLPITLMVMPRTQLSVMMSYDTTRFETATIERMAGHFQTLLEGMVKNPHHTLSQFPLLTEAERHQLLVEWNDNQVAYPDSKCIHQLFEQQVIKTPNAAAVVYQDQQLTYRELNARANQLAHNLITLGVGPEVLVGICLERSIEMVVGLFAILKAGGAYVPLDPTYPAERLAFMLEDAQVPVLLTDIDRSNDFRGCGSGPGTMIKCVTTVQVEQSTQNPITPVTADHLMYVIYTSGSTGRPKGAMNTHRALVNRLLWMQETYQLNRNDKVLQKTPFTFDVSVWEFFWPLLTGATLVVARPEGHKDSAYLVQTIIKYGITTMHFVPSMLQVFVEEPDVSACVSLKRVICSGEALPVDLMQRFFAKINSELHNLYGPTEAAIDVTYWQCDPNSPIVPIGRPVANTPLYILDKHQQPLPIGVPGELHIGGVQVARGYLNRPELTRKKFIPNPFGPGKLYKTGDLCRYLSDGSIEYLGRLDHQVKIRGFRIELGEIEAVLSQHESVREAVVMARGEGTRKRLVAYLVPYQELVVDDIRAALRQRLPDYMVPAAFVQLEAMPLTPNGKINRRALPESQNEPSLERFVPSRTPTEELVAAIWSEVLGIKQGRGISIHDNFFELGGHSLLATQIVSRLRETFSIELPLRRLFESPTVAELAQAIPTILKVDSPPISPAPREGTLPLSFAQLRLWFLEQLEGASATYNIFAAVRLSGPLNEAALQQSLGDLVQRHESLRTTFATVEGKPVQLISASGVIQAKAGRIDGAYATIVDLTSWPESEKEAEVRQRAILEAQQPFDLANGPLLRVTLLRLSEDKHVLLLTMHHIISDGWSMGIFVREFCTLYEAYQQGLPSPLADLPIQYADFAQWQRQTLQSDVLDRLDSYWRKQLAGAPPLTELPTDRPRPSIQTFHGTQAHFVIEPNLAEQIKALGQQEGATLFMTLLAGFNTLLYRYTGQKDFIVGTDVAARNRTELEGLIGFFINVLPLRSRLSGNLTFRALLSQMQQVTLGAYAHQEMPFGKLVETLQPKRNPSYAPLVQVLFVLQNFPMPSIQLSGLTLNPLESESDTSRFDLALFIQESEEGLKATWNYKTDLFEAQTIQKMSTHFKRLLTQIVAQPDAHLNRLELLTEAERKQKAMQKRKRKQSKSKTRRRVKRKSVNLSQTD